MSTVNRKDACTVRAKGWLGINCGADQNFTNTGGTLYDFDKERERRLEKKTGAFILDTKNRFNNVSGNEEARKKLFVKLAQELGFGEMIGEAAVRAVARNKMRMRRAQMSPEQADEERASVRETMRTRRTQMSPEQADEERAKARERMRERRAQMPPDRVAEERAKARERMRERRLTQHTL